MNKNKFYKFFGDIAMLWWCFWSNIRFRKAIRNNYGIIIEDKVNNLNEIKALVKRLYKKFKWTADGPDQLWDAITPPSQTYNHYLAGELKDDCDGFHSLVYYCLYNNEIECYLLTANAAKFSDGHCILLFKYNGKWRVNDYTRVYNGFDTPVEAIENYNEIFPEMYDTKEVVYNGLISYDFNKGKFHIEKVKKLK